MTDQDNYVYKIIGAARFHLPDGMYTIEELEDIVETFKQARAIQNERLRMTMQPLPKD